MSSISRPTRVVVVALSLSALWLASSCELPSRPRVSLTKDQLIAKLVEKGDNAQPGHRETAYAAYRFAYFYAPQNDSIKAKYEIAKNGPAGLVANAQATHNLMARMLGPNDLGDFPASTPEMDLVNLKMLDEGLVGDLSYTTYSAEQQVLFATFPPHDSGANDGHEVCVSTKEVLYSIDSVRKLYGTPSAEVNNEGKSILTYGRFRLVTDDHQNVRLVLFPLFPK